MNHENIHQPENKLDEVEEIVYDDSPNYIECIIFD